MAVPGGEVPESPGLVGPAAAVAPARDNEAFLRQNSTDLPGVINTNLANINFPERYGEIELERMYFAPATGPDYPLVIGVITTSGRLTLTLNYMEETVSTQTMSAIRNRALSFLGLAESGL